MKAGNPKSVLDVYKWLPGHGENRIELRTKEHNLIIEIFYDSEKTQKEECLSIRFVNICFYSFSSFPGVSANGIEYEKYKDFDNLVEFQKSELANKWLLELPFYNKIRHYRIIFLSENMILEVLAIGYEVLQN